MAQAESVPTTSRRCMLTGAVATLALYPTVSVADAGPDAALINLGRRFEAEWAIERGVFAKWGDIASDEADAEINAATGRTSMIVSQIENIPALTLRGAQVKARAVQWCWGGEPVDFDAEATDMRITKALLRDLLAMAGE